MNKQPNGSGDGQSSEPPKAEVLKPKADNDSQTSDEQPTKSSGTNQTLSAQFRRPTYRPTHRATFIGLGVVILVLAVNAVIIFFVIKAQDKTAVNTTQTGVTINSDVLNSLGVSRNTIGSSGSELIVGPDASFQGKLTVGNDVSIAGNLGLNGKLTTSDATFAKLSAGDVSLTKLSINGDATANNLNLRNDLTVVGKTSLQGPVGMSQLLTVNNNANIIGNLSVGGVLTVRGFEASSLVSDTTLTVGGHVIVAGSAPGVSAGSAVGSNGTVSISGSDTAGTVGVNIGTGGGNGMLVQINFRQQYGSTPHVLITAIGRAANVYVNRTSSGFSIWVSGALSPGGYAFDYFVTQ